MKAEQAREITVDFCESKQSSVNIAESNNFDWAINHIKDTAGQGNRSLVFGMSRCYYSTLKRLEMIGYSIENVDVGSCKVSW